MNVLALKHARKQRVREAEHKDLIDRAVKFIDAPANLVPLTPRAELDLLRKYAAALQAKMQELYGEFGEDALESIRYMRLERGKVIRQIGRIFESQAKPKRLL